MRARTIFRAAAALLAAQFGASAQELLRIDASPARGFHWNYYLGIPATLKTPTILLVEPNNSGGVSDDNAWHDQKARDLAGLRMATIAPALGSPLLVPAFPRPVHSSLGMNWLYTHALDRDSLIIKDPGLERIDLQLIAMIEDARQRLAARRTQIEKRVWLVGFSASGSFVIRFTILHPEIVQAVSGSEVIAPIPEWKGRRLRYPVGVADLAELTGKPFDAAAFRQVPIQVYGGDLDAGDAVAFRDGWDEEDAQLMNEVFPGPRYYLRLAAVEAAYDAIGANHQFMVFPGQGHQFAPAEYLHGFFERNRVWPPPPPSAKPMLHTLYFPHVACSGGLETEIVLIYGEEGGSVNGVLRAWRAEGSSPLFARPLTLRRGERKTLNGCRELPDPNGVAYVSFLSDSGFVSGFARFFRPGGDSASVAASKGSTTGAFAKAGRLGSATLAFLNVGSSPASVLLSGYDDSGSEVARASLTLPAGGKLAASPQALFRRDLGAATWFRYAASGKVVAFLLDASGDGSALEGIPVMPEYTR